MSTDVKKGKHKSPKPPYKGVSFIFITPRDLTRRRWQIEFFTISPQHKNGNIANFVLAMPFKISKTSEVYNLDR